MACLVVLYFMNMPSLQHLASHTCDELLHEKLHFMDWNKTMIHHAEPHFCICEEMFDTSQSTLVNASNSVSLFWPWCCNAQLAERLRKGTWQFHLCFRIYCN